MTSSSDPTTPVSGQQTWPPPLTACQMRIVRPTTKFNQVIDFYTRGLGLKIINSFVGHQGYNGVMIGLPDMSYHLEVIYRDDGMPNAFPNKDNMFVFYMPDADSVQVVVRRLAALGYKPVPALNPWWNEHGAPNFEDPDGWSVVLYPQCLSG